MRYPAQDRDLIAGRYRYVPSCTCAHGVSNDEPNGLGPRSNIRDASARHAREPDDASCPLGTSSSRCSSTVFWRSNRQAAAQLDFGYGVTMNDIDATDGSIEDLSSGDIAKELAAIDEKLDTLPKDAFAERVTLHQRHEDLRARAAHLAEDADARRSTEDLQVEVRSLQQRLGRIQDEFVDVSEQSGEGNIPGPDSAHRGAAGLNTEIADAQHAPQLVARIEKLQGIIRGRGVDSDNPTTST